MHVLIQLLIIYPMDIFVKNVPVSSGPWRIVHGLNKSDSVPQRELDEWTMLYCSCIDVPDSSLKDEIHLYVLLCNYLKTTLAYGNPRFRKLGILLWLNMCDFIYIYRWIYILSVYFPALLLRIKRTITVVKVIWDVSEDNKDFPPLKVILLTIYMN